MHTQVSIQPLFNSRLDKVRHLERKAGCLLFTLAREQDESYDHWARDGAELGRIVVYTEGDPVRSGLVASPEEWRWSSAWERKWGRMKDWPW